MMNEERGSFNLTDVTTGICEKLITRHTHIFGKDKADGEAGALSVWERNKMKEKHQETYADAVNDVPKGFPAALRAQKVGKRAAKSGFDFACVEDAAKKVEEELKEFLEARASATPRKRKRSWAICCLLRSTRGGWRTATAKRRLRKARINLRGGLR